MKRVILVCIALSVMTILGAGLLSGAFAADNTMEIVASPNVLNLESNGGAFTIHADIKYSIVEDVYLEINGDELAVLHTFPDDRGDLVVKCSRETIKDVAEVGEATFDLTAYTALDTYFGSDTIKIIQRGN